MDSEPRYKADIIFGHVELRSWFEVDSTDPYRLIGMGSKKTFDQHGKLVAYSESPNGVELLLPKPEVHVPWYLRLLGY